jgi:hypothetical protein
VSLLFVSYPLAVGMTDLVACPFCREMFEPNEARSCPVCGVALTPLSKLPPTRDASDESYEEPLPPHMETLPWSYVGRGRAALVAVALAGLALFFAPWVVETAPELRTMSGFAFAQKLGWIWAVGIAWFVMLPLVLTRRSIYKMRGARVAVAFLAAIVLTTVGVRLAIVPQSSALRPVRFAWGFGLYGSGLVAIAAMAMATRFGGRLDDVPTKQRRRGDETLH